MTALVITAATLEVARRDGGRPLVAGMLLALLPWLRPEGIAVALALAVLGEGLGVLRASTRRRSLVRLALVGGLPVLSQVALELLRLAVYGHLVPNSVIYKSGVGPLFLVPGKFLAQASAVLALAAVGVIAVTDRRWLFVVPTAVYLLGSIGTGDLVNAASRFFLPTWPELRRSPHVPLSPCPFNPATSGCSPRLSPNTGTAARHREPRWPAGCGPTPRRMPSS